MESKEQPKTIGRIDLSINNNDVLNEDTIGRINLKKNIGECKVMVYSKEGPIPHFHIENKDGSFDCCIRIDRAAYFTHGKHQDQLSNKQLKELDKWLREPSKAIATNTTNWELIEAVWNTGNAEENNKYVRTKKQPDYTNTRNFDLNK